MGYQFEEHGGEVEISLSAPSEAGVFVAALEAFAALATDDESGQHCVEEVALVGSDRALLLVDWLNELVVLAELRRFVPEQVETLELLDDGLRAIVQGHRGAPNPLVKAATLSNLRLEREGGTWHGRVVVDV